MSKEREQIIALAGAPVGYFYWENVADATFLAVPSATTPHQGKDDFPLFSADQLIEARNPIVKLYEGANRQIHELRQQLAELTKQRDALASAASDVIDRWNSPKWKDLPRTGTYIHTLSDAVEMAKGGAA